MKLTAVSPNYVHVWKRSYPRVKRSLHYEDQEDDVEKNGPYLLSESIGTNGATGYGQTADFMNVTTRCALRQRSCYCRYCRRASLLVTDRTS
jgi:hypothetical protein